MTYYQSVIYKISQKVRPNTIDNNECGNSAFSREIRKGVLFKRTLRVGTLIHCNIWKSSKFLF